MKTSLLLLAGALCVLSLGLAGCHGSTDSSLTPDQQKQFGKAGMPPPTADQIQKAMGGSKNAGPGPAPSTP